MKRIIKLLIATALVVGLVAGISCVASSAYTTSSEFGYKAKIYVNNSNEQTLKNAKFNDLVKDDIVTLTIKTTQKAVNDNYKKIYGIQYTAYVTGMEPITGRHDFVVSAKNTVNNKPTLLCDRWIESDFNGYLMNFVWMDTTKENMENIPNPMTVTYSFRVTDASKADINLDTALVLPEGTNSANKIKEEAEYSQPVTYEIKRGTINYGSLKINNESYSQPVKIEKGKDCKFEIVPDTDYKVDTITINGEKIKASDLVDSYVGGTFSYTISPVFNNYTISADCVYTGYTVSASVGEHGKLTISGDKTGTLNDQETASYDVAKGKTLTFTFVPDNGYKVSNVAVVRNGENVNVANTATSYTFDKNTTGYTNTINVTFAKETAKVAYTVNVSSGTGGTVTPNGNVSVYEGQTQEFVFTPDNDYIISDVKVDGVSKGNIASYQFPTGTSGSHTIAVSFAKKSKVAYTVNVTNGENGTVTPNGNVSVYEGQTQEFIFTPNNGYKVSELWIDGVLKEAATKYEFPSGTTGSHTIHVVFALNSGSGGGGGDSGGGGGGSGGGGGDSGGSGGSGGDSGGSGGSGGDSGDTGGGGTTGGKGTVYNLCPRDYTCPIDPFNDADNNGWYHDGVHYCIDNGLMNGVGNGMFSPNGTTTRAMIVTILYRLAGSPAVYANSGFLDVEANTWYTNAVAWGQQNGVVTGYNATTFGPNDFITREQLGTILYRYSQLKKYDTSKSNNLTNYKDVGDVSAWAFEGMKWANGAGIITGRTSTTLVPLATATRAEAATMLQRYCVTIVK